MAIQYNFGAARAGVDSQPGHVLRAHTALEIFFISCHRNVSSRKAETFHLFCSLLHP